MKRYILIFGAVLSVFVLSTCDLINPAAVDAIMDEAKRDNPLDSDFWDHCADYPGRDTGHPVTFVIGDKGYIGLGVDWGGGSTDGDMLKKLWEYNASQDSWTQKADFPGTGKEGAAAFVINGIAYIIGGTIYDKTNDESSDSFDCWKYDSSTDSWSAIASIPDSGDSDIFSDRPSVTVADGKGWIMADGNIVYAYDPVSDNWTTEDGSVWVEFASFIPQETPSGVVYKFHTSHPDEDESGAIYSYNPLTQEEVLLAAVSNTLVSTDIHLTCFVINNRVYLYTNKCAYDQDSLISYPINTAGGTDDGLQHGSPALSAFSPWSQGGDDEFNVSTLVFPDRVYFMNEYGDFYVYTP